MGEYGVYWRLGGAQGMEHRLQKVNLFLVV